MVLTCIKEEKQIEKKISYLLLINIVINSLKSVICLSIL